MVPPQTHPARSAHALRPDEVMAHETPGHPARTVVDQEHVLCSIRQIATAEELFVDDRVLTHAESSGKPPIARSASRRYKQCQGA